MIRVVLDANVIISGLLSRDGPPGKILDYFLEDQIKVFITLEILDELKRVLKYPRIQKRLDQKDIELLLNLIKTHAECVVLIGNLAVISRDPSDNKYVECALKANVDYLVTGNMEHFTEAATDLLKDRIISLREFLVKLEKEL